MNTGLQDAYNLGWKLALVAAGKADAALLDSYEAERMPVAQRLLATTDRAFKFVVSGSPVAGLLRTRVLARLAALAMGRPRVQEAAFRTVSQIGIHYRESALSVAPAPWPGDAPQAGDRFPWLQLRFEQDGPVCDLFDHFDDTRFNLLVFGQAAPAGEMPAFGDLLRIQVIPRDAANDAELARKKIPLPSFFVLPRAPRRLCRTLGARVDAAGVAHYAAQQLIRGIRLE